MVGGPRSVRRRRLHRHAARGDAAGRHGRARPREAARRRARRRHRQVGLDGRLPLQHASTAAWAAGRGIRRRAQGRHRQGGDPAGGLGAQRAGRARRRRVRRARPTGSSRRRRSAASTDIQSADRGHQPRRPDEHLRRASTRRCSRSRSATATRRHIILLTDGWSSSGQYDAILKQMKADGITLSTVGAGGGANPFLEQLAQAGRRPLLRGDQPGVDPRHLPQGDAAGLRPADRRGAVLPDPDLDARRSCAASTTASRACSATTARPPSRPRRRCSSRRATTRSSPSGSTASGARWPGRRTRPGRWAKNWVGWQGFSKFFSQLVGWTFPGEESGGIEASFVDRGGRTYLRVESVRTSDGSARDFYTTQVALVGPDLAAGDRRPEPGRAGRLRGTGDAPRQRRLRRPRDPDARPASAPLGRTLGLVAPTAAEYRLLGANEPLLAAMRDATGGRELDAPRRRLGPRPPDHEPVHGAVAAAARPRAAAVAAGHRAAARVARAARARRRAPLGHRPGPRSAGGPRTQPAEGLFAARKRAGRPAPDRRSCARRRTARRRRHRPRRGQPPADPATAAPTAAPTPTAANVAAPAPRPVPPPRAPVTPRTATPATPAPPAAPPAASPPAASTPATPPPAASPDDTLARLREAKARRRS